MSGSCDLRCMSIGALIIMSGPCEKSRDPSIRTVLQHETSFRAVETR